MVSESGVLKFKVKVVVLPGDKARVDDGVILASVAPAGPPEL